MEAALQDVLQRMQSGSKGIQDDAEEERAIRQICHSASLSSDHLEEVTLVLWPILLQAVHAPTVRLLILVTCYKGSWRSVLASLWPKGFRIHGFELPLSDCSHDWSVQFFNRKDTPFLSKLGKISIPASYSSDCTHSIHRNILGALKSSNNNWK